MPRDLFGNVTRPSISIGSRKWYTVPVSLISHSAIVLALVAIPIFAPAVMPSVFADQEIDYIVDLIPPPPPPPPALATPDLPPPPITNPDAAPIEAPTGISAEQPQPEWRETPGPSIVSGFGTLSSEVVPPPPPPLPPQPVRPGFQGVRPPVKTHHVDPDYPQIAQSVRVQGMVIIEATIGEDGRVTDARVLRPVHLLLDRAALEAVRQWQYTPTLLNGRTVPVIMTVTVNFTLK